MLAIDERTLTLPVLSRHGATGADESRGDGPTERTPARRGTAIYHCYRYASGSDPAPTYADDSVPNTLPADPRGWRLAPWKQCERNTEFDSAAATSWLRNQLRLAVEGQPRNAALDRWAEAIAGECAAALNTLVSAYHTVIDLPEGHVLALAIVAIWDSTAIHPLLRIEEW